MPTYQGEEFLERCLAALATQVLDHEGAVLDWDFLAIDSGSTDDTLSILKRWRARFPVPLSVESIHSVEFNHGDTRNLLASRSTGDLLVFLTQDAIPIGRDWLARLARNFDDAAVGAAYCRNVARSDARAATKVLSAGDPGYATERRETRLPDNYAELDPHQRRVLYNFNDVASAIPRELWERHPFPRTQFGEDVLMARALLEAGFTVVYDADGAVEHSHDYSEEETRARTRIDGAFNAEWLDRICFESRSAARAHVRALAADDARAIAGLGLDKSESAELEREVEGLRRAAFEGLWEGGQSELRHRASSLLDSTQLSVLFVVHGFPPDTWAGTEIYTLELATALQRRGHRVTVLARAPAADESDRDFSVRAIKFRGLRVLRMTHRIEHRSLRESYVQPRADEAFRDVLARERPDVVHFQHLIHMSTGLVHVATELGLPTVMHCHDYWSICARVQLIRPDGVRCEENMGAGCLLCVKDRDFEMIPRARRLGNMGGPLLKRFAKRAERAPAEHLVKRRWEGLLDMIDRPRVVLGAYAAADLLVSPSRFLREKLLESGAFDPQRFVYSDNGIRSDHLHALAKAPDPEGRLRVAFVGTLAWYKGGDVLVKAMGRLSDSKIVARFYGSFEPDTDEHHAQLAREAGDNVEFCGRFDNAKLSEVYAEIDVLVVPSIWFENSPITIHEAYLARTPVVASNIGGMAEYVRDGVDGLLFDVGSDESLARALRRFLDEPELLESLSEDWMRIKSMEENAAETEFRYRALLSARRGGGVFGPLELLRRKGKDTDRRRGPTEQQGADMLLLRPGGASVEYHFDVPIAIQVELVVELFVLGDEAQLALGGRVVLNGEQVGRIEPFTSGGTDAHPCHRFELQLQAGDATLRLETVADAGGPEHHLRLASLLVRESQESPS